MSENSQTKTIPNEKRIIMKNKRITSLIMAITTCFAALSAAPCCIKAETADIKYEYGVFLGADPEDISYMENYRKIVIDAQYFEEEEISELKEAGHTVYSYLNLGSVEKFRPYYKKYKKYSLGTYENWTDEKWIDVSQKEWQDFVVGKLAKDILDKGVDGLWVDNCDVYYNFKNEGIFNGVTDILTGLKAYDTYVIINGGDTYISKYAEKNKNLDAIMDAVNQETVFSAIDWDNDLFTENDDDTREYFQDYCKLVSDFGKDVYLLEYTENSDIIDNVKNYCRENGYTYYASNTLDLLTPGQEKGSQLLTELNPEDDYYIDPDAIAELGPPGAGEKVSTFKPGFWEVYYNGTSVSEYIYFDPNGKDFISFSANSGANMGGEYILENDKCIKTYETGYTEETTASIYEDRASLEYPDGRIDVMSYISDVSPEDFSFLCNAEIIELLTNYYEKTTGILLNPCCFEIEDGYGTTNVYFTEDLYCNEDSVFKCCTVDRFTGEWTDENGRRIELDNTPAPGTYFTKGLWKCDGVSGDCEEGYYWFSGNEEDSVSYDITEKEQTDFSYHLSNGRGIAYMNDNVWFFACDETDDGLMLTWYCTEGALCTEKLTFIGSAEKNEVVWNNVDVVISAAEPEIYTAEDAERFKSFLLGNRCDLGNKNYDCNRDGIWNIFDLIEMRKIIGRNFSAHNI